MSKVAKASELTVGAVNFDTSTSESNVTETSVTMTPNHSENGYSFYSMVNGFKDRNFGMYAGVQTNGNLGNGADIGNVFVFSIWNATSARPAAGSTATPFGGEGVGYSLRMPYNWSIDTPYTIRIYRTQKNPSTNTYKWAASITNQKTLQTKVVGEIVAPSTASEFIIPQSLFHERFIGTDPKCFGTQSALERTGVTFSNFKANNKPANIVKAVPNNIFNHQPCRPYIHYVVAGGSAYSALGLTTSQFNSFIKDTKTVNSDNNGALAICDLGHHKWLSVNVRNGLPDSLWSNVTDARLTLRKGSSAGPIITGFNGIDAKSGSINISSLKVKDYPHIFATVKYTYIGGSTGSQLTNSSLQIKLDTNPADNFTNRGCKVAEKIKETNNFNSNLMGIGSTFDYEIAVTNSGPTMARTLKVVDTMPPRVTILAPIKYTINGSPPNEGESCTVQPPANSQIKCTIKNLESTVYSPTAKKVIRFKAVLNSANKEKVPYEYGLAIKSNASVSAVCTAQPGSATSNCSRSPSSDLVSYSSVNPRITDITTKQEMTNEFDSTGNPINWKNYDIKITAGAKVAYKIIITNNEYVTNGATGERIKDNNGNDIKTDSAQKEVFVDKIPAGLKDINVTHDNMPGLIVSPESIEAGPLDIKIKAGEIAPAKSIEIIATATYVGDSPNINIKNTVQHLATEGCVNSDGSNNTQCSTDADSKTGNCNSESAEKEDDCSSRSISQERVYDMTVLKTVDKPLPINKEGEEIEYTIRIINNGPADSPEGLSITDAYPDEVDYISNQISDNVKSCNYKSGKLSCKLSPIKPGDNNFAELKIKAKLNKKSAGLPVKSLVEVECLQVSSAESDQQGEVDCVNNKAETTIDPQLSDIQLIKKVMLSDGQLVDTAPLPQVGETVTFMLQLSNSGPDDAKDIDVKDYTSGSLEFLSGQPSIGSYSPESKVWSIPVLQAGSDGELVINTMYKGGEISDIKAEVIKSSTPDKDSLTSNCKDGKNEEDDCSTIGFNSANTNTNTNTNISSEIISGNKIIGVPMTGTLIGKIIAIAAGLTILAYLCSGLIIRHQKITKSER